MFFFDFAKCVNVCNPLSHTRNTPLGFCFQFANAANNELHLVEAAFSASEVFFPFQLHVLQGSKRAHIFGGMFFR